MSQPRPHRLAVAASAALFLSAAAALHAAPSVLYRENFDNPSKADRSLKSVNWEVVVTTSFDDPVTIPVAADANRYAVVNGAAGTGAGAPGYIWSSIPAGGMRLLRGPVTKWPAPTVGRLAGGAISVDAVASNGGARLYLLVQLDSRDWYLSATEFSAVSVGNMKSFDAAPSPAAVTQRLPFVASAGQWQTLTIEAGKPLAFSVPAKDLPAEGVITGVGVLVRNIHSGQGATVRLDTLSLEVAEPAR